MKLVWTTGFKYFQTTQQLLNTFSHKYYAIYKHSAANIAIDIDRELNSEIYLNTERIGYQLRYHDLIGRKKAEVAQSIAYHVGYTFGRSRVRFPVAIHDPCTVFVNTIVFEDKCFITLKLLEWFGSHLKPMVQLRCMFTAGGAPGVCVSRNVENKLSLRNTIEWHWVKKEEPCKTRKRTCGGYNKNIGKREINY